MPDSDSQNQPDSPIDDSDVDGFDSDDDPTSSIDQAMQEQEPNEPETRDEEMMRLRREVDEANKRVLQAQADAENFRKRMRRDYEDQLKYAAGPLVLDLLQVRDNLIRAVEASEATGGAEAASSLREGVQIVTKQLDETLAKYAIREIPAAGEVFDPNYHEAISQMPSEEAAEGTVAHVAVTGFQMHDRVLRPAQVIVSTGNP